jgi:hypothetical protein
LVHSAAVFAFFALALTGRIRAVFAAFAVTGRAATIGTAGAFAVKVVIATILALHAIGAVGVIVATAADLVPVVGIGRKGRGDVVTAFLAHEVIGEHFGRTVPVGVQGLNETFRPRTRKQPGLVHAAQSELKGALQLVLLRRDESVLSGPFGVRGG